MVNFIKQDGEKVLFNAEGELIYFVPEKYFDLSIAYPIGEVIELMGIFPYALFNASGKMVKMGNFKAPTMIQCIPNTMTKETKYHLQGTKGESDYRLLHFKKGDELICNINVANSVDNVEKFVRLVIRGHLPESIPYDEVYEYFLENASLNGFNYKVSPQIIGVMISEIYRETGNLSKPFRLSSSDSMLAYEAIPITMIPKYTSPYTAITSENADEAVAAALTTSGTGESPLEKVMMD